VLVSSGGGIRRLCHRESDTKERERERILKRDRPIWTHVQNTDQDEWDM
jgi:hypothetical protein